MNKENKRTGKWYIWVSLAIAIVGIWGFYQWRTIEDAKIQQRDQERIQQATEMADEKLIEAEQAEDRLKCLASTEEDYNSYLELNGTKSSDDDRVYKMPQSKWDYINKQTNDAKELCLKQYPTK